MPSLPRLSYRSLRLLPSPNPLRLPRATHRTTSSFPTSSSSSPTLSIPPNWHLTPSTTAIEKSFQFKNFKHAWEFMTKVTERSERRRHHPEWANVYNKVTIKWTTHSARGLTEKDTDMARACDEVAEEVEPGKNP